jgi:hypothetical protein
MVLVIALASFGVPAAVLQIPLLQLALFGFLWLSVRCTGRNLAWMLGLPRRKASLAWFNFALNLSLFAMTSVAVGLVVVATEKLGPEGSARRPFVLQPVRLFAVSDLHGRALAIAVFLLTAIPFLCWSITRPPEARTFARRQRILLIAWMAGTLSFMLVATRGTGPLSAALTPLVLFVAGTAAVSLAIPYSTANALGASHRQRRAWTLVGGAIGLAEILLVVAVTLGDLRSADPGVREQAAQLFGPTTAPPAP